MTDSNPSRTSAKRQELNLAQRLAKIMKDVGYIKKRPKGGAPYPFVAHDDLTEALRESFLRWGVLCLPSVVEERQEGNRCVLKVSIVLMNVDNIEDAIAKTFVGHGVSSQDKGPAIALTYAVKMGLLKMLMIPTGEKDAEEHQVEQSFLDTDLVTDVAQAITDGDGAKIKSLMHDRPDEVQIAVWRHLNTAAKKTAKQLLAELPA